MRNGIDGYNDDALAVPGTTVYSVLNRLGASKLGVTTGKVFCLRTLKITNEHATETATVEFYDEAEAGTPGAATAANQRLCVLVGPKNTVVVDFTPGVYFKTGICAGVTLGTIAAYSVHVSGYEE